MLNNQQALRIVTNTFYAYNNGTHFAQSDKKELDNLIEQLINMKYELITTVKELKK